MRKTRLMAALAASAGLWAGALGQDVTLHLPANRISATPGASIGQGQRTPDDTSARGIRFDPSVFAGDGSCGEFASMDRYGSGLYPSDLALGDLEGDGDLDIFVASELSGDINVLLNFGNGRFVPGVTIEAGHGPRGIALGDLEDDGDVDIVVANAPSHEVSVLLNNGDGTFGPMTSYGAGFWASHVALGDLDDDGDLDMAVANSGDDVCVLLNQGDGSFSARSSYHAGYGPRSVALGDVDTDGDLDMAVANFLGNDVTILLNDGNGVFGNQASYGTGLQPIDVSLDDLDGDGDIDVVAVNHGSGDASALLNDGRGVFAPETPYATGEQPQGVCLVDVDDDGDTDMAVANSSSDDAVILLNNGDGTFAPRVRYICPVGSRPCGVALGDLDGDGDLDMTVANSGSHETGVRRNRCVSAEPCNRVDLAPPYEVIDLDDLLAFVGAFLSGGDAADLAEPYGVLDLDDIVGFFAEFEDGCPPPGNAYLSFDADGDPLSGSTIRYSDVSWSVFAWFDGSLFSPSAYFGGFTGLFDSNCENSTLDDLQNHMHHQNGNPRAVDGAIVDLDIFNAVEFGTNDPSIPILIFTFDSVNTPDGQHFTVEGTARVFPDDGLGTAPHVYEDIIVITDRIETEEPCSNADLAGPVGVIDPRDTEAFLTLFGRSGRTDTDVNGVYELNDIAVFFAAFHAGCS